MKLEVCILAGGLSTRMGRDKTRLRLGGRTMLSIIRNTASELGCPVRTIRRDVVARCGPLGGVITGLKSTRADAVLFLACDMPLVSAGLLKEIVIISGAGTRCAFAVHHGRVGFPFLLPVSMLVTAELHVTRGALSIHSLAAALKPRRVRVPSGSHELMNINTPAEVMTIEPLLARTVCRPERLRSSRSATKK